MVSYNGSLYVGGGFLRSASLFVNGIARWDSGNWFALGSGLQPGFSRAEGLAVYNGNLFAGGDFTGAGGITCNHIAQWSYPQNTRDNLFPDDNLALSPNPFTSTFTLTFQKSQQKTVSFEIQDILGNEILRSVVCLTDKLTATSPDLQLLRPGI